MGSITRHLYRLLMGLACVSMASSFVIVMLSILSRQVTFINIQGLDAYAGYAIAATLFFALPGALIQGDHIRVTLVLDRLNPGARNALEWLGLVIALGMSSYLAWFAARAVWVSYITHDVSPAADATPLWIPQLSMAIGCAVFALAFLDAMVARLRARPWFTTETTAASE